MPYGLTKVVLYSMIEFTINLIRMPISDPESGMSKRRSGLRGKKPRQSGARKDEANFSLGNLVL